MKKFLGFSFPSKKVLTSADFREYAKACGYAEMIGLKIYEALCTYYEDPAKITQANICKIPDEQVETIKGIKIAGHKIINYIKIM